MRTVYWDHQTNQLKMIDQRLLPGELTILTCDSVNDAINAIKSMAIRGAPAIGVCAAYALVLAIQSVSNQPNDVAIEELKIASQKLLQARPTAVNLAWGLKQVMEIVDNHLGNLDELREKMLAKVEEMASRDIDINRRMAVVGADLINDGDTILHHCNTGALATVDWGTALGVIRMAHEQGKSVHVLVDETRPLMQGARLTAWELGNYHIPYEIITDSMAGFFLKSGQVNRVLFGGDRVAANGDVANKIGTYMLSLAAHANHVPIYSVVPTSTIDLSIATGNEIPIEVRSADEVLDIQISGKRCAPLDAKARNPAFDITPHEFLDGLVTEKGILRPPFSTSIAKLFDKIHLT